MIFQAVLAVIGKNDDQYWQLLDSWPIFNIWGTQNSEKQKKIIKTIKTMN